MNTSQLDMLAQGMQNYGQEKSTDDPDLVEDLRAILVTAGLQLKLQTAFDNNPFIIEAIGKVSNVQRFLLNRYLGQQLLLSTKPAVDERYCLIPNGKDSDWLLLIEQKIIPFMLDNNLPVPIGG